MDLRDRLKAMGVRPRTPGVPSPPSSASDGAESPAVGSDLQDLTTRSPLSHTTRTLRKRVNLEDALPGDWFQSPEGPCYYVERRYAVTHVRGTVTLGHLLHS